MVGALLGTSGCLSHRHLVPKAELERLTKLPPSDRGQQVRSSRWGPSRAGRKTPSWSGPQRSDYGPDYVDNGPNVGGGVFIGVHRTHVYGPAVRPRRHHRSYVGTQLVAPGAGPGARNVVAPGAPAPARPVGKAGVGSGAGAIAGKKGGSKAIEDSDVDDFAAAAVVATIAGVALGVGLAASEGGRFDGTVATSPDQPLTLKWTDGKTYFLNLSELHPSHLDKIESAYLNDDEFFGLQRLRRAPLDRGGLPLNSRLAAGVRRSLRGTQQGFAPLRCRSVRSLGRTSSGGRPDLGAGSNGRRLFQRLLVVGGPGISLRAWQGSLWGLRERRCRQQILRRHRQRFWCRLQRGCAPQIDLTTRLALTGRLTWDFHPNGKGEHPPVFGGLVGLSVY